MADGKFYEDVGVNGSGFIIPSVTNTYQLPVERETLLRLIRNSCVPLNDKKKFKQFCCQLVNVPLDDEVVCRVWNFLCGKGYEDKDETGLSKSSQKGVRHAKTNQRESLNSGKHNMELTSSVVEQIMEKDSNRESSEHHMDQECLNLEVASKNDTSHEMTSEKSKTSNGPGNCMQSLSLKSEPLSEDDISSHVITSVKSEPIFDLVPCAVEPISYEFDKFDSNPLESKFVCQDTSISESVSTFNLNSMEQCDLNPVYQTDDLAQKASPDVADPFITFRFVLDSTETNSSVSPHESAMCAATKPVGNVLENVPQTDCQIDNCSQLIDSNLSSKTSFHENDQLIEVNEKEMLSSKENELEKKDRKKDRIVNQTVIGETFAKNKKSSREDDDNQTSDSVNVPENSSDIRKKRSPRKGNSQEDSCDVGKKRSPRKCKSFGEVAVSEDLVQNNKSKKRKLENYKDDSSKELESTSSVVLEVSSKGQKKNLMTEHKPVGENLLNGLLNKKKSNSKKHSVVDNEHHCGPENTLRPERHKSSNLEKLKGRLLNNALRKKNKQAKKLKMKEELKILRNVMEVLVDQISQLPQTHKTVISKALIKKSHSLEKTKHIHCMEHNNEESNNTTDESIRKPRKKNNHNVLDNNTLSPLKTKNKKEDMIKQGKKHQIKINQYQMSSSTVEDNERTESCKEESNCSGIQSNAANMKTSKKKKQRMKAAHVDTCSPDPLDVSYKTAVQTVDNQTQVIRKKLKSSRHRCNKLSASICDSSDDSRRRNDNISGSNSLDYSSGIESDCAVKRGRFLWKEMILEILRAHLPFGLPYDRLQKKVIKKYSKERGRISLNTARKFERYLSKIPGIFIHQNTVMLSEPASETTEVTRKRKQRNIVIEKVVKTTKYVLDE